jgi:hypothetical protein
VIEQPLGRGQEEMAGLIDFIAVVRKPDPGWDAAGRRAGRAIDPDREGKA